MVTPTFTSVAIAPSIPTPVPVVEQSNLPLKPDIQQVIQEASEREQRILTIKQSLAEQYDNLRNPEPFLAG